MSGFTLSDRDLRDRGARLLVRLTPLASVVHTHEAEAVRRRRPAGLFARTPVE